MKENPREVEKKGLMQFFVSLIALISLVSILWYLALLGGCC